MIPKKIFFIWIGNVPKYVDFCINSFSNVNKDYDIIPIIINLDDLNNIENYKSIYIDSILCCIDNILKLNGIYNSIIKHYIKMNRKFISILCNILRIELLNKYGGIYLDCDTFPLRPFDDYLLSLTEFCSYIPFKNKKDPFYHRQRDCNFMGWCPNSKKTSFYQIWNVVNVSNFDYKKDPDWNTRRDMFFNCKLDYKELSTEYYIEHYEDNLWVKNLVPKCKFDEYLYDKN